MNRVQLMGRMAVDLALKYTNAGKAVLNFRVATNKKWIDKTTNEKQERVEFHNCVCYEKGAETLNKYSAKGKRIYVEGELRNNSWDDKETGQKKYSTEIHVNNFEIIDFVEQAQPQQQQNTQQPQQQQFAQQPQQQQFVQHVPQPGNQYQQNTVPQTQQGHADQRNFAPGNVPF